MTSMSPSHVSNGIYDASPSGGSMSPHQMVTPKNVAFELVFTDAPQYRARLPMRVQIYPHDTTDSIVTTVKNFYGLYSGPTGSKGVSFEDRDGNTLIARYENFSNNMIVYVRVFEEYPADNAVYGTNPYGQPPAAASHQSYPGEGYHTQEVSHPPLDVSRHSSRSPRRRSPSPNASRGRRNDSANASEHIHRSRSIKGHSSHAHSQGDAFSDNMNGYSSDEGARSTTSGKNKDQLGNTDISLENIVEGGRRKRAKFESSMPAATSNPSVSPARRVEHQRASLPAPYPGQNPFVHPRPIQNTTAFQQGMPYNFFAAPASQNRHNRMGSGAGNGADILPTPDPTVGSCMSEEDKDVALQLMRLGDMSNISHGRTSASTLDDTFSGKADAASSTGATSDGEGDSETENPPARRQKLDNFGNYVFPTTEAQFAPLLSAAEEAAKEHNNSKDSKPKSNVKPKSSSATAGTKSSSAKAPKVPRPLNSTKSKKLPPVPGVPESPVSAPPSRKQSITSNGNVAHSGEDDQQDLSTKPRCQRCRKSKKGCDRQRPCGRCKDAGLTADQCISEDEGNGRKGRYGRHMGVPIKKDEVSIVEPPTLLPAAPILGPPPVPTDKSKKRKR